MDDPTLLKRLRAIEEQLEILSERAGVSYSRPGAGLPPTVRELALSGKKIQAIQELRQLTGASLGEAKQIVDDM
jgi:ribosomal protein L7/L12